FWGGQDRQARARGEHEQTGGRVDLEGVDRDRADVAAEGVHLEQDLAGDMHSGYGSAVGQGEMRASDDADAVVLGGAVAVEVVRVVAEEDEVDVARDRPDVLDARADGACDLDRQAVRR